MSTRRQNGRLWALVVLLALVAVGSLSPSALGGPTLEQVSLGTTGGNGSFSSIYLGASTDGTKVIFRTEEKLVSADTDAQFDLYSRSGDVTELLSTGPIGGNGLSTPNFEGVSADGRHVFFETGEPLVSADADGQCDSLDGQYVSCQDVYDRADGVTTLVSTGSAGATGNFNARFRGASDDGSRVFFTTRERLEPADTDDKQDVYERSGGTTKLVSTGSAGGNGAFDAYFKGASRDGTRVFFVTAEPLVSGDTDSQADVYERSGGTTTLVSTGSTGGNGAFDAAFRGTSADGSHVFFETDEPLVAGDTDTKVDLYDRSGGSTTRVSTGPAGGNGAQEATFAGNTDDGSHVFFETNEALVSGDIDSRQDVYDRSGGTTTLVSTGPTGGNGASDAYYEGASKDGSRVFVGTSESLVATDTDTRFDLYQRSAGTTTLISTGPAGGNGAFDAYFDGTSQDGTTVVFETFEHLTSGDADSYPDVYARTGSTTTLLSTGAADGTSYSTFEGMSDDAARIFFVTADKLLSADTDAQTDVYSSTSIPGYPRPKSASPLTVSLLPAYKACTAPNRIHGPPPLAGNPVDQSCNPPVPTSDWLTVGTADSNGQPTKSIGRARINAIVGDPATPADEADVRLALNITDVRRKSDLSDYTGQVQVRLTVRITDKLNGAAPVDPGTVSDVPFDYDAGCTATTDTTIGSTCDVTTTAEALVAGAVTEGRRAVWELADVNVYDGGADGNAGTEPNTLFARQGIFIP